MDAFVIEGGRRLRGRMRVHGAKNAALPLMAATLLSDQPVILSDVPKLSDIDNMNRLLQSLGCTITETGEGPQRQVSIQVTDATQCEAAYDIVRTMRASICVLGPMLARRGEARVSMPGGCAIGARPVDIHLRGLKALGAHIELDGGYIVAKAPRDGSGRRRLKGNRIFLGGEFGSTVTGTTNILCAATLAEGTTIIELAACEPEVADLASMLNAMGAKISGAGTHRIVIEGVESLGGTKHRVMADRIEAGTYVMAAAITNGDIVIENCPSDTLMAVFDVLQNVGVHVEAVNGSADPLRQTVHVGSARRLQPAQITTQPYPGFPTDLQSQIMALLCLADGNSIVTEKIFPDRYMHMAELSRMGANLIRTGATVLVTGTRELKGAPVMASDLRASAGLVLAGLAASGTTTINRVYHLDRGYEEMDLILRELGADIRRVQGGSV